MFAGVVHDSYSRSSPVAKSSQAFYPTEMPKQIRSGRTTRSRYDSSKRRGDRSYAVLLGQRSLAPRTPHEASGTCGITKIARWSTGAGRAAESNQRAFSSVLLRCRALAQAAATSSLGSLTCGDSNLRVWERPASAATCARRRRRGGRSPSLCYYACRRPRRRARRGSLVPHGRRRRAAGAL